jgi:hypothetical protein
MKLRTRTQGGADKKHERPSRILAGGWAQLVGSEKTHSLNSRPPWAPSLFHTGD